MLLAMDDAELKVKERREGGSPLTAGTLEASLERWRRPLAAAMAGGLPRRDLLLSEEGRVLRLCRPSPAVEVSIGWRTALTQSICGSPCCPRLQGISGGRGRKGTVRRPSRSSEVVQPRQSAADINVPMDGQYKHPRNQLVVRSCESRRFVSDVVDARYRLG